jgi:hypothetical protein
MFVGSNRQFMADLTSIITVFSTLIRHLLERKRRRKRKIRRGRYGLRGRSGYLIALKFNSFLKFIGRYI